MDLEGFAEWLQRNGVPQEFVPAYGEGARKMVAAAAGGPVRPKHVDTVVNRAAAEGASGKQMANLARIGEALIRYQKESEPALPAPAAPAAPVAATAPAPPPDTAADAQVAAAGLRLYVLALMVSMGVGVLAQVFPASSALVVVEELAFLSCSGAALWGIGRYFMNAPRELGSQAIARVSAGLLALAWLAQVGALVVWASEPARASPFPVASVPNDGIAIIVRLIGYIVFTIGVSVAAKELGAPSVIARARPAWILLLMAVALMCFIATGGAGSERKLSALTTLEMLTFVGGVCFHLASVAKLREFIDHLAGASAGVGQ